ncbi:Poly(ADP-ribose) polymerase pme-1 [Diplonema papillatum]|nr:Poly(ADP-ribose) polymerase pme-1 [Diplonema papillatum]
MFKWSSGSQGPTPSKKGGPLSGVAVMVIDGLREADEIVATVGQLGGKRAWSAQAMCVLTSQRCVADGSFRGKLLSLSKRGLSLVDGKAWLLACRKSNKLVECGPFVLQPPSDEPNSPIGRGSSSFSFGDTGSDSPGDAGDASDSDIVVVPKATEIPFPEQDVRVAQPNISTTGLPSGASDKATLAKYGPSRPVRVGRGGFVRAITREELNNMDKKILAFRILHCCVMSENKNKFYVLELSDDNKVTTHYGRTDDLERDANAGTREVRTFSSAEDAKLYFGQLCTEKYNVKKYRDVAVTYARVGTKKLQAVVSEQQQAEGGAPMKLSGFSARVPGPVLEFVDDIFEEASSALTSVVSARITKQGILTPLGVLSEKQVTTGSNILDEIHVLVSTGESSAKLKDLERLSSEFYTTIPHRLGRGGAEVSLRVITTLNAVQEKRDLLQLMTDMNALSSVAEGPEALLKYKSLRCAMTTLNPAVEEFSNIRKIAECYHRNVGVRVSRIFSLHKDDEHERFEAGIRRKQRLLHATKPGNIAGVLSHGLLLPKAVVDAGGSRTNFGWLGSGIYFSDASCTASRYAPASKKGKSYMFIATVALGNTKQYTEKQPHLIEPPPTYNAVQGLGKDMPGGPSFSEFNDNEFVVYKTSQVFLEYLVECTIQSPLPPPANEVLPKRNLETSPKHVHLPVATPEFDFSSAVEAKAPKQAVAAKPFVLQASTGDVQALKEEFDDLRFTMQAKFSQYDKKLADVNAMLSTRDRFLAPAAPRTKKTQRQCTKMPTKMPAKSKKSKKKPALKVTAGSKSQKQWQFVERRSNLDGALPQPVHVQAFQFKCLTATSPVTNDSWIVRTEQRLRSDYAQGRGHEVERQHEFLLNVYDKDTLPLFTHRDPCNAKGVVILGQHMVRPVGEPSVCPSYQLATANLKEILGGQLDGLPWENLMLAGGSVLAAISANEGLGFQGADLDLFMHGIDTDEKALQLVETIVATVQRNRTAQQRGSSFKGSSAELQVFRTSHSITIAGRYPNRHIQIVLRMYKSPSELLAGFDVDACTVAWDGYRFWANPRALRALNTQVNTVDLTRRSLTYEVRLAKYARRGFAVHIPEELAEHIKATDATLREAKGLEKLVKYDTDETAFRRKCSLNQKKSGRHGSHMYSSTDDEKALPSDYSIFGFYWGPAWSTQRILSKLDQKDKGQYFLNRGAYHRHVVLCGNVTDVLKGYTSWCTICCLQRQRSGSKTATCSNPTKEELGMSQKDAQRSYVFGPPTWMRDDPGRQLMTGSFHPVSDDEWTKFVRPSGKFEGAYKVDGLGLGGFGSSAPDVDGGFKVGMQNLVTSSHFSAPATLSVAGQSKRAFLFSKLPAPQDFGFATHQLFGDQVVFMTASDADPPRLDADRTVGFTSSSIISFSRWLLPAMEIRMTEEAENGSRVLIFMDAHAHNNDVFELMQKSANSLRKRVVIVQSLQPQFSRPNPLPFEQLTRVFYQGNATRDNIYVGASGREYKDADYRFAVNCGMVYATPQSYFSNEPSPLPPPLVFDPRTCTEVIRRWLPKRPEDPTLQIPRFDPSTQWLVFLIGYPGSGKSTFATRHMVSQGFVRINRDTIGSMEKCLLEVQRAILSGASVVIDNLNSTPAHRAPFLKAARDNKLKVGVVYLDTSKIVALHMNSLRAYHGAAPVPAVVYSAFDKQMSLVGFDACPEHPFLSISEDILAEDVHVLPFVPEFDTPMDEKYFFMLP